MDGDNTRLVNSQGDGRCGFLYNIEEYLTNVDKRQIF